MIPAMTTQRQIEEAQRRIEEARKRTAEKMAALGARSLPNTGRPKTSIPGKPIFKGPQKPAVSAPMRPNLSHPPKPGQVTPMELPSELFSCYLFTELTRETLGQLVPLFSEKSYGVNETIFSEGETARNIFIIKSGRVDLKMNLHLGTRGESPSVRLLSLGRSDVFGLSSLMKPFEHNQTAVAQSFCSCILIDTAFLNERMKLHPEESLTVLRRAAEIINGIFEQSRDALTAAMFSDHAIGWLRGK